MASKVKPCCGRSNRAAPPTEFCSSLRITSGVTLLESGGSWLVNINHNGNQVGLAAALSQHQCATTSAGVKLSQVVLYALNRAVANGLSAQLRTKANRQMPIILLKDFLFNLVGKCSSCKGRGCSACNSMGVA